MLLRRIFLTPAVREYIHCQVYLMGIQHRIGPERNEVLIETIISPTLQILRDTRPFLIKYIYVKTHTLIQKTPGRIGLQEITDPVIGNIISQMIHNIRF